MLNLIVYETIKANVSIFKLYIINFRIVFRIVI